MLRNVFGFKAIVGNHNKSFISFDKNQSDTDNAISFGKCIVIICFSTSNFFNYAIYKVFCLFFFQQ